MQHLIAEGDDVIAETENDRARDAVIIAERFVTEAAAEGDRETREETTVKGGSRGRRASVRPPRSTAAEKGARSRR
jgi:hypothetical protein